MTVSIGEVLILTGNIFCMKHSEKYMSYHFSPKLFAKVSLQKFNQELVCILHIFLLCDEKTHNGFESQDQWK